MIAGDGDSVRFSPPKRGLTATNERGRIESIHEIKPGDGGPLREP
jgi:hypothetical protein